MLYTRYFDLKDMQTVKKWENVLQANGNQKKKPG